MMTENKLVVAWGGVKETWIIKEHKDTYGMMSMYSMYIILIVVFGFTGVYIDHNWLNCILKYFKLIRYQLYLKTVKTLKSFHFWCACLQDHKISNMYNFSCDVYHSLKKRYSQSNIPLNKTPLLKLRFLLLLQPLL